MKLDLRLLLLAVLALPFVQGCAGRPQLFPLHTPAVALRSSIISTGWGEFQWTPDGWRCRLDKNDPWSEGVDIDTCRTAAGSVRFQQGW